MICFPAYKFLDITHGLVLRLHDHLILVLIRSDLKSSVKAFLRVMHQVSSILRQDNFPILKVLQHIIALVRAAVVVQELPTTHANRGRPTLELPEQVPVQLKTITVFPSTSGLTPFINVIGKVLDDKAFKVLSKCPGRIS